MRPTHFGWLGLVVSCAVVVIGLTDWLSRSSLGGAAALIGLVGVALGLLAVIARGVRPHPLSTYALFAYSNVALFVLRPGYSALFQADRNLFTGSPYDRTVVIAATVAAAGFIVTSIGYSLVHGVRRAWHQQKVRPLQSQEWGPARGVVVVTLLAGSALYSIYVLQVGGIGALISVSSGRSVELTTALAGSSGYFTSGLLFTTGAAVLIYCQGLSERKKGMVALGLALMVYATGPQLLSGSRSVFLPLAVTALVAFVRIRPGRVRPITVALLATPAFLVFFIVPRLLRQLDASSGEQLDLRQIVDPNVVLGGFLGGLDTAMIDSFAVQIGAQMSGLLPTQGGLTYVAALGAAVPRDVWATKPEAVDTVLNQALFPETAARGIGFSFGIYSEPYLNFGTVGVLLIMALFGVVLAKIDTAMASLSTPLGVSLVALASGSMFALTRGSLSFDLQRLLVPGAALVLVAIVLRLSRGPRGRQGFTNDFRESSRPMSSRPLLRSDGSSPTT